MHQHSDKSASNFKLKLGHIHNVWTNFIKGLLLRINMTFWDKIWDLCTGFYMDYKLMMNKSFIILKKKQSNFKYSHDTKMGKQRNLKNNLTTHC